MRPTSSGLFLFTVFTLFLGPANAVAVTGVSAGVNNVTGERPLRRDIKELYMSGPAWDLFVLALREFQEADQDDPLSYYQVAGIHGYPQVPWDGVLGGGEHVGYCAHGAVIFPTWHRPYMALFEQIMWNHAQRIAHTYPLRQRDLYIAAALSLRMPYWDAFADPEFPIAASLPTIIVNSPNGTQNLPNPLYNYTFHPADGGNRFPSENWLSAFPSTFRHWDSIGQQSNVTDIDAALEHQYDGLLPLTYKLFASESDYTSMSCTTSRGNSVENIHNLVHNAVGGYGHMSDAATSAFDPIFWLHHTNIDRLFAMWQAINPQSYIVPTVNAVGTYAEPRGFVDTGDSGLLPFHSDNGTRFWTSNGVRSTRTFGYTYPEVIDWNKTPAALASSVRESINRMYNPALANNRWQRRRFEHPRKMGSTGLATGAVSAAREPERYEVERQWVITIQFQRFAYQNPFAVDFFVGSPPINASAWPTASNLIGSHAQFIAANSDSMHLHGLPDILNHGQLSLTHCLSAHVQKGDLANLEPAAVIPFLVKGLNWRARDMKGCELELNSLAALSIAVGSQVVRPAKLFNQFPTYDALEIYEDITSGKPGGVTRKPRAPDGCD